MTEQKRLVVDAELVRRRVNNMLDSLHKTHDERLLPIHKSFHELEPLAEDLVGKADPETIEIDPEHESTRNIASKVRELKKKLAELRPTPTIIADHLGPILELLEVRAEEKKHGIEGGPREKREKRAWGEEHEQ